jgi:hypothetical protein
MPCEFCALCGLVLRFRAAAVTPSLQQSIEIPPVVGSIAERLVFRHATTAKRDGRAAGQVKLFTLRILNNEVAGNSKGPFGETVISVLSAIQFLSDIILIPQASVARNHDDAGFGHAESARSSSGL